jgi:hypothetical protein
MHDLGRGGIKHIKGEYLQIYCLLWCYAHVISLKQFTKFSSSNIITRAT